VSRIDALVAPSARDLTRTYMMAQLGYRSITGPWESGVPETRPDRFFTIEELNAGGDYGTVALAESQLLQIRAYDTFEARAMQTGRLIKALWAVMPAEFQVQEVEHVGGPSHSLDPNVPGLHRATVIAWVTVMTAPE
jgi:hypothetical protein